MDWGESAKYDELQLRSVGFLSFFCDSFYSPEQHHVSQGQKLLVSLRDRDKQLGPVQIDVTSFHIK